MRVQSRRDGNSAGESGSCICIICTHELTGRSRNWESGRIAIQPQHENRSDRMLSGICEPQYNGGVTGNFIF